MDRQEILEALVNYNLNTEPDDNGEYDINSYDFQSGCYINREVWLNLASVVSFVEQEILPRV